MRPVDPVVFVFGATGYVGAAVVEAAARVEHVARVVGHARPDSKHAGALEQLIERLGPPTEIDRTPLDVQAMAQVLERLSPTHVFLCHGTTAKRARKEGIDDPYGLIDVGLTKLVADAASSVTPAPRLVYLSSIGTSQGAGGGYLRARWRAEEIVRQSGLPFTICRAPLLTGPDRRESRTTEAVARVLLDPLLSVLGRVGLGKARDRYSSMDAAEAAEGLVRSGFHYMTIDRVVESDELRRVGVYERESWAPRSRRDTPRH